MTSHDRFLELAASEIDFQLRPDEANALHRHLAGCESCRPRIGRIRDDARTIAALPLLRPGWSVPALVLGLPFRRQTGMSIRLIAVTALTLAVVGAVVGVGAELIRRQQVVVPTTSTAPSPTAGASAEAPSPSPTSAPSSGPVAAGWHVESIDLGDLPFGLDAVAASGSRLVAVGWRTCASEDEPGDCWADVFTSDEGGRSWVAAPRSDALLVPEGGVGSGPEPGMLDVAAGHGAFVAIGYGEEYRATTWMSVDGSVWTKSPVGATFEARVRSVAATATGWVIGGEVFLETGPRAAIWTSPDGVTWTRVPDGPAFDIGGYLETGEEPGAGGIADIVARGSTTIAVGSACDGNGRACVPATWTSTGGPWTRSSLGGDSINGSLRSAATFGQDLIAAGFQCGLPACAQADRLAVALRSADGTGWTESTIPGTSGSLGIRALAATDDHLVGVVDGVEGIDGIDARPSPELILVSSIDGDTWELLDGVPDLGLTDMRAIGIAATADGSIVVVGYGQDFDQGFKSFVVLVTRVPG